MVRRSKKALTAEEVERREHRQSGAEQSTEKRKPTKLLSRLKIRRSAGEGRSTIGPAERAARES